jgi:hypothetical protein
MKTKTLVMSLMMLMVSFLQSAYGFYNPTTGRWLSRDPIEEKCSQNLYVLVRNNSVSLNDKLGLETVTDAIWSKSDYTPLRVLGPVGSKCCNTLFGSVKIDYAYIKAALHERMGENHQDVIDYVTSKANTTGKAQASIQASSYLEPVPKPPVFRKQFGMRVDHSVAVVDTKFWTAIQTNSMFVLESTTTHPCRHWLAQRLCLLPPTLLAQNLKRGS